MIEITNTHEIFFLKEVCVKTMSFIRILTHSSCNFGFYAEIKAPPQKTPFTIARPYFGMKSPMQSLGGRDQPGSNRASPHTAR